jgi:hypothetical protein
MLYNVPIIMFYTNKHTAVSTKRVVIRQKSKIDHPEMGVY